MPIFWIIHEYPDWLMFMYPFLHITSILYALGVKEIQIGNLCAIFKGA